MAPRFLHPTHPKPKLGRNPNGLHLRVTHVELERQNPCGSVDRLTKYPHFIE